MAPSPSSPFHVYDPHAYASAVSSLKEAASALHPFLLNALGAQADDDVGRLVLPGLPSSTDHVKGAVFLNFPPSNFSGTCITDKTEKDGHFLSPTLSSLQAALGSVGCDLRNFIVLDRLHLTVPLNTKVGSLEQKLKELKEGEGREQWKEFETAQEEVKRTLLCNLPREATVLIASKTAAKYHRSFLKSIGGTWKTCVTCHPCVVLGGVQCSEETREEADENLTEFGFYVTGDRTETHYFSENGGTYGEEARLRRRYGGADETAQQKECKFGGANESVQQKEARKRCAYGAGNETDQQKERSFGGADMTDKQKEARRRCGHGGADKTDQQKERSFGGADMTDKQKQALKQPKRKGSPNRKNKGDVLYKISPGFEVVASFKTQDEAAKDVGAARGAISQAISRPGLCQGFYFAYGIPGHENGLQENSLQDLTTRLNETPEQKKGRQSTIPSFFSSK